jgi:flagellar hook-associated protein 3 FlgL
MPATDLAGSQKLFEAGAAISGIGETGLIALEVDLGISSSTLQTINDKNESERTAINTAFQNLFGRDQYEAAAELQLLQTQLEASYAITSRLSNLSLTNFLR